MADLDDAAIDAALSRGAALHATEPRAVAARYDRRTRRIVVTLSNGSLFAFPPALAQGLERAGENDLAAVQIIGTGYGLHWDALDVDLSVPGLLAGIFGTAAHMARRAGLVRSPAKAATSRANGAKGGRPRRAP